MASSNAEIATFVVKLTDVAPDGHSTLIVDGSLNGTRNGVGFFQKQWTATEPRRLL